ncbi:MAG: vWA domain-containing protein [Candidatus Bipolaricaulia bacterium]
MIFLSAWAFGLLGLAGVIAALYFLRRREERLTVSAIWLWQEEPERPRSALAFLWTNILLLLVQLAVLAALVFAVAQPMLTQEFLGSGTLAVILDGSASMQTQEQGKTRYERALDITREIIERRRPSRLTVIQAQRNPKLLVPVTEDRAHAQAVLQASRPTLQSDAPPSALTELLRSQGGIESFHEILYVSDHAPSFRWDGPLTWVPVGEVRKNLAITGFAARPMPEGAAGVALWARVENFSSESVEATLKFFAEDREILAESLRLGPNENRDIETVSQGSFVGRFRASLEVSDDFVFDNVRYSLVPDQPALKVLWLGERNFFLERALSTFAKLHIETEETADYDLAIANNTTVRSVEPARFFLINSSLEPLVRLTDISVEPNSLKLLQAAHPLVQNVRVEHLRPTMLRTAELAPPMQTIIQTGDWPVLAIHKSESAGLVYLGTDLKSSPLVLTPSFPILVYNVVRWLLPDWGFPSEQLVSEEFDTPGFTEHGAVNLDPSESAINRVGDTTAQRESLGTERAQAQFPVWYYGAWMAFALLIIELFLHYRGLFRYQKGETV